MKKHFLTSLLLFACCLSFSQINDDSWKGISGEKYDYSKTMLPERGYMNEYHQMQVMKLFMSMPDGKGGCDVKYTFEDVLGIIKKIDCFSVGLKKIIFLVGWQYNGHDDKYPAWNEVNNALKRPQDKTGRESMLWLAREARKYNTYISVHVNMTDAYKDSPFWEEYFDKGLISKNADGSPMEIGFWNNRSAYQVCYTNEWESGYAVKRINYLLDLLPFIKDAGAIMIDAFFCRDNPYEKITALQEEAYQRKICRYFRNGGIDVTNESFNRERTNKDLFVGISPWFLWLDMKEADFLTYPANLVTGGAAYCYTEQFPKLAEEQLALGFLFGMSGRGEDCFGHINKNLDANPNWESKYRYQFYTGTLPYVFLNKLKRIKLEGTADKRKVYFSSDVVTSLEDRTMTWGSNIIRSGDDVFIPAVWRKEKEIIAYSKDGYKDKYWKLPADWAGTKTVKVYTITNNGQKFKTTIPNEAKGIKLSLEENEAVLMVKD